MADVLNDFLASTNDLAPANQQTTPTTSETSGADLDQFIQDTNQETYGTPEQQQKAFVEGAGQGLIGPIAPYVETHLFGVKPEDILARQQANPWSHGLGEAAGLGAGLFTDFGLPALMGKAGEAVAGLGLAGKAAQEAASAALAGGSTAAEAIKEGEAAYKAAPYLAKVGSSAVKQAVEFGIMQGSDEISKQILQDPNASAQSAIANIGLSAALGGATGGLITGAVSPLWKATIGDSFESFWNGMTGRMGGVEGAVDTAQDLATKSGVNIDPVLAAKINGDPYAEKAFSILSQRDSTIMGRKFQGKLDDLYSSVSDNMANTLGVTPEYAENIPSRLDKYTQGSEAADTLHNEIKRVADPISDEYDKVTEQFRNSLLSDATKKEAADKIAQKAMDNGWLKAADNSQENLMNSVLKKLPEQETADDLKKFITNLRESHSFGSPTYQAAKDISSILKDSQEKSIIEGMQASGATPEAANQAILNYQGLKSRYAGLMDTIDGLNEHLKVGKYYGPQSFLNNLKEMGTTSPEAVINRLANNNRADTLKVLEQFPETSANVKKYHVDNLISSSKNAAGELDPRKLIKNFNKNLSPQVQDFIANDAQKTRLDALGQILNKINDSTHNWSNTARTTDKLLGDAPTALTMLAAMFGHGGQAILAHIGRLGIKEGQDGIRYAVMRMLGSNQPVKAEGFRAMAQYFSNIVKNEKVLDKSTQSLLKTGASNIMPFTAPSAAVIADLAKKVADYKDNPAKVDNLTNGHVGYYLPAHQTALTQTSVTALKYCQSLQPQPSQNGPLNRPVEPSAAQNARYNRCLTIAQQPMMIVQHCKDGTLQATDLQDVNAMYPAFMQKLTQKISNELANMKDQNIQIPYKTKMCLSMLLGQSLDSSMQPMSIQAAQPQQTAPMPIQGAKKGKSGSPSKLGTKSNKMFQTPGQAAEADSADRD